MDKAASTFLKAVRHATTTEPAACEFLERQRWGSDPACPRCGATDVYKMRDRETGEREKNLRWRCRGCEQMFSVRTGTVLEESRLPLRHWVHAFWRACSSKKGVSALQISRECGITHKSALFLMHRIRLAMAPNSDGSPRQLEGTIEADETFVGGKPRFPKPVAVEPGRWPRRRGIHRPKAAVMAMVERGGDVRALHIGRVNSKTLKGAIREHVAPSARIVTDEWNGYRGIGSAFAGGHETVKHAAREYVRGDVYTNTVEGFFSLLKRGIYGTFHSVSKHHLHRYLAEFEFRYNTRKSDDATRTVAAIRKAEGKRLLYRQPAATA